MIMEKLRATFYCENCRPCFARDKRGHCTAQGIVQFSEARRQMDKG